MTTKWHGGKGSQRRSKEDQKAYSDNYDRIFNKKEKHQDDEEKGKEDKDNTRDAVE